MVSQSAIPSPNTQVPFLRSQSGTSSCHNQLPENEFENWISQFVISNLYRMQFVIAKQVSISGIELFLMSHFITPKSLILPPFKKGNNVMPKEMMIPDELVISKIYLIRGQKVMLDRHLANLYGVTTGNLNKAVKRNLTRFSR